VTAWALTQETWSREFDRMRRQIEHLESDLRDLRNARNRERVDLEQQLSDERSRRQLLAQRVDSLESQIRAAGLVPVTE
jgi:predicted  nucleic acid-binding Zn-ribbon protein